MIAALLLTIASHVGPQVAAVEHVDCIEVNHFYDETGRKIFDQAIFYEWNNIDCRHNILAWRLIKERSQRPVQDYHSGGYRAVWHDGGLLRDVRAATFRETWTQYDPEQEACKELPKARRKELIKP